MVRRGISFWDVGRSDDIRFLLFGLQNYFSSDSKLPRHGHASAGRIHLARADGPKNFHVLFGISNRSDDMHLKK